MTLQKDIMTLQTAFKMALILIISTVSLYGPNIDLTPLDLGLHNISAMGLIDLSNQGITNWKLKAALKIIIESENNVRILNLSDNLLVTLPETIGLLQNLIVLKLSNNFLLALPESIGQLHNLVWLHVQNNMLTSIPDSIRRLPDLKELCTSNNHLNQKPNLPEVVPPKQKVNTPLNNQEQKENPPPFLNPVTPEVESNNLNFFPSIMPYRSNKHSSSKKTVKAINVNIVHNVNTANYTELKESIGLITCYQNLLTSK